MLFLEAAESNEGVFVSQPYCGGKHLFYEVYLLRTISNAKM